MGASDLRSDFGVAHCAWFLDMVASRVALYDLDAAGVSSDRSDIRARLSIFS